MSELNHPDASTLAAQPGATNASRSSLDTPSKVAAWLRIVASVLCLVPFVWLTTWILLTPEVQAALQQGMNEALLQAMKNNLGLELDWNWNWNWILWGLLTFIVAQCVLEIAAGVLFLCGVQWARYWLIGFAALNLFNFPVGTAIGVYTLSVLTRALPQPNAQV